MNKNPRPRSVEEYVDTTRGVQGVRRKAQQHNGDAPKVADADLRRKQHLWRGGQSPGDPGPAVPQQSDIREGRVRGTPGRNVRGGTRERGLRGRRQSRQQPAAAESWQQSGHVARGELQRVTASSSPALCCVRLMKNLFIRPIYLSKSSFSSP